ncbi:hypothetical protein D3C85_1908710 [compost metagenome]
MAGAGEIKVSPALSVGDCRKVQWGVDIGFYGCIIHLLAAAASGLKLAQVIETKRNFHETLDRL